MRYVSPQHIASLLSVAMSWRAWVEDPKHNATGRPTTGYGDAQHMTFPYFVAQWELDAVCEAANAIYTVARSPLRIGNSMGELRPGHAEFHTVTAR